MFGKMDCQKWFAGLVGIEIHIQGTANSQDGSRNGRKWSNERGASCSWFFFCVKTFTGDKTVVILKANVPTGTRVQLEDVYIYIYYTHYNLLSLLLLLL